MNREATLSALKSWTLSEIALAQILFLIGAGAAAIVLIVASKNRA